VSPLALEAARPEGHALIRPSPVTCTAEQRSATLADPVGLSSSQPFPFEAVRDALGLARLLYLAVEESQREQLAGVGRDLRLSLEQARAGEGTLGHRAALDRVERATKSLVEVLGEAPIARLAVIARARVCGEEVPEIKVQG
jgi:hypothetical protein